MDKVIIFFHLFWSFDQRKQTQQTVHWWRATVSVWWLLTSVSFLFPLRASLCWVCHLLCSSLVIWAWFCWFCRPGSVTTPGGSWSPVCMKKNQGYYYSLFLISTGWHFISSDSVTDVAQPSRFTLHYQDRVVIRLCRCHTFPLHSPKRMEFYARMTSARDSTVVSHLSFICFLQTLGRDLNFSHITAQF